MVLLVAEHGPKIKHYGENAEAKHLIGNAVEVASTDENGADGIDEVVHRVERSS